MTSIIKTDEIQSQNGGAVVKMQTLKHPSASGNSITLASDGSATIANGTLSAGTLGSSVVVPASIGGNEILLETYTANNSVGFKIMEFTGSYNLYRLRINYLTSTLDNSELKIELGDSSSSFSSGTSDYRFVGHFGRSNGSNHYGGQLHVVNSSFIHFDNTGSGDSEGASLDVFILSPKDANEATVAYGTGYVYRHDNYVMPFSIGTIAKYNPRSDSHIHIFFNQGNLNKGKILLYGVKDA